MARKATVPLGDRTTPRETVQVTKPPRTATRTAVDQAHKLGARIGQPKRSHKAKT